MPTPDNLAYIQFAQAVYSGMEGNPPQVAVTLTRTGKIDSYANVELQIVGGTATQWQDFASSSPLVSFQAGETSKTVYFDLIDDYQIEGTETLQLALFTPPGVLDVALGVQDTATLSILDNEVSYIQFAQAVYSGMEGNQPQVAVTLTRTGKIDSYANVELQIAGGTATQWQDFASSSPLVSFQAGETSKTVYFDLIDDYQIEGTETLQLALFTAPNISNVALGAQDTATLSILDNEVSYIQFAQAVYSGMEGNPPQVAVTLTRTGNINSYANVELQIVGGTATQWQDLSYPSPFVSFQAGETSKTVYFDLIDDNQIEGTETVQLALFTPPNISNVALGAQDTATLSILDNEVSYIQFAQAVYSGMEGNPPQVAVTLTRTGNINNYANVEVQIVGGTATQWQDFASSYPLVSFQVGETSKTVYFDLIDDYQIEGTETVQLALFTPPNISNVALGAQDTATLSILDNEVSYIQFAQAVYSGMEGNQPQVAVTLTRTGNINSYANVELQIVGGTATQWQDFSYPSPFVSFQVGETSKTVYFDLIDDYQIEGTETVQLALFTPPNISNVALGVQNTASLSILDNEVSYIQFAQAVYSGSEDQAPPQAAITLTRTGNLNNYADVQLELVGGSATPYSDFISVFPQIITFAPQQTSQTFYVDILADGLMEEMETINFKISAVPTPSNIVIGSQNTAVLEIRDIALSTHNGLFSGFETANFLDWNTIGHTSTQTASFGVNPTEGNYQALLTSGIGAVNDAQLETFVGLNMGALDNLVNPKNATEGSAIKREITVNAGDTLEFNWNFFTNESFGSYYSDFAFVSISANEYLGKLADTNSELTASGISSFGQTTGYKTFSHQFSQSGTFTVSVGILDVVDNGVDSALVVDNFSVV